MTTTSRRFIRTPCEVGETPSRRLDLGANSATVESAPKACMFYRLDRPGRSKVPPPPPTAPASAGLIGGGILAGLGKRGHCNHAKRRLSGESQPSRPCDSIAWVTFRTVPRAILSEA